MSEDTTIPLPGGLEYRDLQRGCGNGNVRDATGKIVSWLYRSQAEKLSAAMNAAQATVPPSRGDGALGELAELSAKATQGEWKHVVGDNYHIESEAYPCSYDHRFSKDDTGPHLYYIGTAGNREKDCGQANSQFIVALVNTYRSGKLIPAPTTHPGAAGQPVSGSGGVLESFWLAPDEPTQEMVRAAYRGQPDAINAGFAQANRAMREVAPKVAAPTPPATASSGAAVAVSVEEVERLVSKACSNYYQLGLDGNTLGLAGKSCAAAFAAIRSLAAQQDKDGVREALEWYADRKNWWTPNADNLGLDFHNTGEGTMDRLAAKCGTFNTHPSLVRPSFIPDCGDRARAALKTATVDQPGREGEGSDGWRPIETAPKDGSEVLILTSLGAQISAKWDAEDCEWTEGRLGLGFEKDFVTHWRCSSPAPRQDGAPQPDAHPHREQGRDTTEQEDGRHGA